MNKRIISLLLIVLLIASAVMSCAENNSEKESSKEEVNQNENIDSIPEDTTDDIYNDDLPEQDFGGTKFRIAMQDAFWLHLLYDSQEETGELLNDAVYRRNRKIEERFNVEITQTLLDYGVLNSTFSRNIRAGIDDYEIYLLVDRDALSFGAEGMTHKLSDLPNVNITKPYWSQSLNKCLTIGGDLYFAYGSFNLSAYDYTHVLLFNKQMISNLGLESPYNLVTGGNWTFDKYAEMARAAVKDVDGDGVVSENDIYGLLSMTKYVLPCFWVAAGVQSIAKSSDDIPQFTLRTDEKFANVIEKIFAITYDNNSWSRQSDNINSGELFMNNRSLFSNATYKSVGDLRSMETDFGIIPYPKWNEQQERHYTRVEGGNPGVVPVTASNLQMIGTILESLHSESAKIVIPAYYDVSLKTKYARDEESSKMLDLIFENRIYDLGDTYWCNFLRDGIFLDMFKKNDRNLASQLEKVEPRITAEIDKVVSALINN